jgi:Transglycosylase SLT domain
MRTFLVVTILLLGPGGAAPQPEETSRADSLRAGRTALNGLIDIESSVRRGDRLSLAVVGPRALRVEFLGPEDRGLRLRLGSSNSAIDTSTPDTQTETPIAPPQPASVDDLCNALFTSAQDNDLPVPFFANLLWQESRLRDDVVSKKGAQGIAQFMPKVAVETGLANPFDPMQAIPASARFLQRLRLQFGNLGFVAAAYNAGAHRVIEWLERRASLPRETRDYVVRVTGLSVETWKTMPIDNDALTFVPRLPCRSLPAFATVEQEQMQQTELDRAKQTQSEEKLSAKAADEPPAASKQARNDRGQVREALHLGHENDSSTRASTHEARHAALHVARAGHPAKHEALHVARESHATKHEAVHVAREGHAAKHEASHAPHAGRERHRSA